MNATDLGAVTRRPVTHAAYFDDFERWCEECVTVADKLSGLPVPFRLNAPQKRLARVMEARRRAGRPVRVILLKARQWGGSCRRTWPGTSSSAPRAAMRWCAHT